MREKGEANLAEQTDHQIFRETIDQLHESFTKAWISAAIGTTAILSTAAKIFRSASNLGHRPDEAAVAFIALTLTASIYVLVQCHQLRQVRDRLKQQLGKTINQSRLADKFYGLSILDPLTGLHNRRFGEERLHEEMVRTERNGDPLALLTLDLDYFKEINDQFGHAAGDAALKEFSRTLRRAIRACDIPVRIGGDEFLVILPDCPREKVDVILSRLGSPEIEIDGQKMPVRYSVGRSHYEVGDTVGALLTRADERLYQAKKSRFQGASRSIAASKETTVGPDHTAFDGRSIQNSLRIKLVEASFVDSRIY